MSCKLKYIVLGIPEDKYDSLMRQMALDRNFSECEITEIPEGHDKIIDKAVTEAALEIKRKGIAKLLDEVKA